MSRLFISHSSRNDDWAIALKDWLVREGWSGENDIFLDLDPERGIVAGQRWARALEDAATRCEAVLYLVSAAWLASNWCWDEYQLAKELNKKLFALLIDDLRLESLPGGLTAQWQVVRLKGEPAERFLTVHPRTQTPSPVHIAKSGLANLKRGLDKAGIGAETFELQPSPNGPFGWRAPYRGLEALEPEDAAVFFGRNADMVRGVDALRGLASHKAPRLLVILGASGAGKSSLLRAGLWPRLLRDDSQWLPLKAVRASRGGAIDGGEGLLAALEEVHARFALRTTRAALRDRLATPGEFIELLRELRQTAARRVLLDQPPYPLPVLCLDQGEELFAADADAETARLLQLTRAAIDADEALLLVTIRSDSYDHMQNATVFAEIQPHTLSLGPVPQGETARIIREPSDVLRRKAGPQAPAFDAGVVEQLQKEIAGETDALPLLAFVLQRLMREHSGAPSIGLVDLERSGGVAAAIEREADAALADAGYGPDRVKQRDVLRRLFIPRLARIDRESKAPQRRVARQSDLPADLARLARALTERRLLVVRVAGKTERGETGAATLEVAHEALLRRWPTLADLLAEDRDALLMLDGVLVAANDWEKEDAGHKPDFLSHRGTRLADAQALATRGLDWAREIAPAQSYLAACAAREAAEREEKEAALAQEQARLVEVATAQERTARLQQRGRWMLAAMGAVVALGSGVGIWQYWTNLERQAQLDQGRVTLIAELAASQRLQRNFDSALRLAVRAVQLESRLRKRSTASANARTALASALWKSHGRMMLDTRAVRSAAFSPDGTRIVTASADGTARVWATATGEEMAVLRGHEGAVRSAAFSPDGSRIVTAADDRTARVWDAASGKVIMMLRPWAQALRRSQDAETGGEIAVLRAHEFSPRSAAFSPDGTRIFTVQSDAIVMWDVATTASTVIAKLPPGQISIRFAALSPDGARILTFSYSDGTGQVWDAATLEEIAVLRGRSGRLTAGAFSPDGTRIVTADDQTARVWDAANGEEIALLRGHEDAVWAVAFSPNGTRVVTGSFDRTARVWDVATGKQIAVLRGHLDLVETAAVSANGTRIVTASADGTARVWKVATSNEIALLRGHEDSVFSAVYSPDGARIVTASRDNTARVWDPAKGEEIAVLRGHERSVISAALSLDGTRIVTASADGTARVWDAATGKELTVLRGDERGMWSAAFSPDGTRVVTTSRDNTARVWDATTGKGIAVLRGHEGSEREELAGAVVFAAFSPDGSRIVTASRDRTARVWDAATGNEIGVLRGHRGPLASAAFSPDGTRIVTASSDWTARLWDARTAKEIAVLRGHKLVAGGIDGVVSAVFSPDGTRIVTASADGTARVWATATGEEMAVLRGHEGAVRSAAFSPDGSRIVTAADDRTARVWDAASGNEIAVLRGHEKHVYSAGFGPDGTRIVTASSDNTARVWDVRIATMSVQGLVAEVCLRRLRGLTTLTREEMRLVGYADMATPIDACASTD